ncbi:MAG: hypothetical protein KIT10_15960 [Flavobacteriales bacterium]|nr:hypothetical protein [Flavobacteriales bacterium]
MKTLLLAHGLVGALLLHDFYVSICTIRHNPETRTLDITWRMTTHDLEHTLLPESGDRDLKLGTGKELPEADSLIAGYLLRHLKLNMDGRPLQAKYLGKQVEMDDLYGYLQVDDVGYLGALTVHATLLQDLFDEQENVVHLEAGGRTRSHSFLINGSPYTFATVP